MLLITCELCCGENNSQLDCVLWTDDVTVMTSSSKKCMLFCNLFIEQPSWVNTEMCALWYAVWHPTVFCASVGSAAVCILCSLSLFLYIPAYLACCQLSPFETCGLISVSVPLKVTAVIVWVIRVKHICATHISTCMGSFIGFGLGLAFAFVL